MSDLRDDIRRVFEQGIGRGDERVIDELIDERYINHDFPDAPPGREGLKQVGRAWRAAFPDIAFTLHDVLVDGDRVMTRGTFTGTHRGDFNGIPATGRRVEVAWMDMWRAADGRFVENWVRIDMASMLSQLGVLPAPAAPATA
jgi:predicted ester cyclase